MMTYETSTHASSVTINDDGSRYTAVSMESSPESQHRHSALPVEEEAVVISHVDQDDADINDHHLTPSHSMTHDRRDSHEIGYDEQLQQEADYAIDTPQNTTRPQTKVTPILVNGHHVDIDHNQVNGFEQDPMPSKLPDTPSDLIAPIPNRLPIQANIPTVHNPTEDVPRYGMFGVYAALIMTQVCWSGFHIFAKIAFNETPTFNPVMLPCIRAWGTAPLMFLICYSKDRNFWRISRADLISCAILGTLICAFAQNLFNAGLMLTTAADGGLTQPGVPVFAACLAVVLKREKASWLKFGGIGCAVLGTFCIVLGETYFASSSGSDDNSVLVSGGGAGGGGIATNTSNQGVDPGRRLLGIACFIGQTFFFAVYMLIQKPILARVPAMTITFYTFLFGIPTTTVIASYFLVKMDWSHLPGMWFAAMIYTVCIASVAAFLLFAYASKHLPASASSMGITLQPFFSSILGATILGEVITGLHIVGGVFLIAGLTIVLWSRSKESAQLKLEKDLEMMRAAQDKPTNELGSSVVELTSDLALPPIRRSDSSDWTAAGVGSIDGCVEPMDEDVEAPPTFSHEQAGEVDEEAIDTIVDSLPRIPRKSDVTNFSIPAGLDHNPAHISIDDSVATGSKSRRRSDLHGSPSVVSKIRAQLQPNFPSDASMKDHPRLGSKEEDPFQ